MSFQISYMALYFNELTNTVEEFFIPDGNMYYVKEKLNLEEYPWSLHVKEGHCLFYRPKAENYEVNFIATNFLFKYGHQQMIDLMKENNFQFKGPVVLIRQDEYKDVDEIDFSMFNGFTWV